MPSTGSKPPRPRTARFAILALVLILAAAIAAWSALWYMASRKTNALLTAWIQNEAQIGRNWGCPERRISGYPFSIEVSCANLLFQGEVLDGTFTGVLRGFHAVANVLQPDRVTVRMVSPFVGRTPDGAFNFRLLWDSLNLQIEGLPVSLPRLAIAGKRVELKGVVDRQRDVNASAQRLQTSLTPAPGNDSAFDFQINLNDISAPAIATLGLAAPLNIALGGTMTQAKFSMTGKLADRLEQWRAAGGQIDLHAARLTSGEAKVDARGVLDLDGGHRIRGKLDATFVGLNPILSRLGVDPRILAAGSLLTAFLGHSTQGATQEKSGDPGAMSLPVKIADGRLSIGPIRTPVRFAPLY